MASAPADFNAQIIEEFRANDGRVGGMFEGVPLLLLHHTGARSGTSYVNPVAYHSDGDRYLIIASKAGAPGHPGWYHNLKAHPNVTVELGGATFDVTAREVTGAERDQRYRQVASAQAQFAEYEQQTDRVIPVSC